MAAEFVHLHVHSEYSMLDGAIRIKDLVKASAGMDAKAVAVTDHGNMYGAVQLYKECKSSTVKPILGCELYVTAGSRLDKDNREANHLVALAASQEGYQNLVRLVSLGWVEGLHHGIPRIDFDLVRKYSKGLVGLSGCMGGYLSQQILLKGENAGRDAMAMLRDCFEPGHFFVELEDHGFPENGPLNEILVDLAKDFDLPIVATNAAHFIAKESAKSQLVLQCIGAGRTLREMEAAHHNSSEMYLKSPEQMIELFRHYPEAIRNTLVVAEMTAGKGNPLSQPKLPRFPVPEGQTEDSFIRECAFRGLSERFVEIRAMGRNIDEAVYRDRLELELGVIVKMGFSGYFLIVQDFINWAKKNDCPVGPGRGSGAGSIVAYALRITDLDPIPYNLLFERFLNPERVSMPDFDVDFCMDRRERVIDYVRSKYGHSSVGQIATFHQLKSKSVVRDVGRVMGMAPQEAGNIATHVPEPVGGKTVPIKKALEQEPKLKLMYDQDPAVHEVLDRAMDLENLTRHAGMHAAGVVISEGPIWDHVPVFCPSEGVLVTQYYKDDVEAAGLVKFDFLGLKTLTVIDIAQKLVNKRPDRQGNPLDVNALPLDDLATFALLQSGETTNVFQLESSGMQQLFRDLKPDRFEDIVAAVALYRPGPLGAGMHTEFVQRKRGRKPIEYPHDDLADILEPTLGIIVYQEQVMQIPQSMAGYTLGGADLLRRAMGKKKPEEMAQQRAIFLKGALERGYEEQKSNEIFDLMEKFAEYGFNKSHSAAYALITYQTAYLKTHYPVEFVCATLSADKDKIEKVVRTVSEARTMGITVLPPDVNESEVDFTVVYAPDEAKGVKRPKDKPVCQDKKVLDPLAPKIRFGLGAIKGLGGSALEAVLEARRQDEDGKADGIERPFQDLFDFCARSDMRRVNKAVCEALVQCGAFDSAHAPAGIHRSQAFAAIESAIERGKKLASERNSGQTNLFGLFDEPAAAKSAQRSAAAFPAVPQWDAKELLTREKQSLGFYVSGHPLDRYGTEIRRLCNVTTATLADCDHNTSVTLAGSVEGFRERPTKTGGRIGFVTIEDSTGSLEIVVGDRLLKNETLVAVLKSGEPVLVTGKVRRKRPNPAQGGGGDDEEEAEEKIELSLDDAKLLSEALQLKTSLVKVKLDVERVDRPLLSSLRETLEKHPGNVPVSLELSQRGQWTVALKQVGIFVEASDGLRAGLERLLGSKVCEFR
ncbi:MAG: DNA polymerase III subunit alpha [Polyangiales bacterium]